MRVEEYVNSVLDDGDGARGRAVLETLGVLLPADVRGQVLREALRLEGSAIIPEDPFRLRAFVEGPLRLVLRRDLGPLVASFVVEDLQPVLTRLERTDTEAPDARADEHDRPTRRPSSGIRAPEVVAPAAPRGRVHSSGAVPASKRRSALPMVVVATAEPRATERLEPLLFAGVEVYRVTREHELLTAVQTFRRPLWVVVDMHRRVLELGTLAVFLPRVPEGCELYVWGPVPPEDEPFANRGGWERVDAAPSWAALAASLCGRIDAARRRA